MTINLATTRIDDKALAEVLAEKTAKIAELVEEAKHCNEQEKLRKLQQCLSIQKEFILGLINQVIANIPEDETVSWQIQRPQPSLPSPPLPQPSSSSSSPSGSRPPSPDPAAAPPSPDQAAAPPLPPPPPPPLPPSRSPALKIGTFTIPDLGTIKFSSSSKTETIAKLMQRLSDIQQLEARVVSSIERQEFDSLTPEQIPEQIKARLELLQAKQTYRSSILEYSNKVMRCSIPQRMVYLASIREKLLRSITDEDWRSIVEDIEHLTRERTLWEEYQCLEARKPKSVNRIDKLQKQLSGNARIDTPVTSRITEAQTELIKIEEKQQSLRDMLKQLVRVVDPSLDISQLTLEQIMQIHNKEHVPGFPVAERRLDAQRLITILQSTNPFQELTEEDLDLLITKGVDVEKFLQFLQISKIQDFLPYEPITEQLRTKLKNAGVPSESIEEIFNRLETVVSFQFANSSQEITADLDGYLEPLKRVLDELKAKLTAIPQERSILEAKLARVKDPVDGQQVIARIQNSLRRIEVEQQDLEQKIAKLEKDYSLSFRSGYSLAWRQKLFAQYLEGMQRDLAARIQVILSKANKIKVPAASRPGKARSSSSRDAFLRRLDKLGIKRREEFISGQHITMDEYDRLMINSVCPAEFLGATEEEKEYHKRLVAKIRHFLQERFNIDPENYDVAADLIFQAKVLETIDSLISNNQIILPDLEKFLLGMQPGEQLVVPSTDPADPWAFRAIPREESRAFLMELIEARARNAWFAQNIARLHQPPQVMISKCFSSAQIKIITECLNMQGFNPLSEDDNKKLVDLIQARAAEAINLSYTRNPKLEESYFLLALEEIINRDKKEGKSKHIISKTPPYELILSGIENSAYEEALRRAQPAPAQHAAEAATSAAAVSNPGVAASAAAASAGGGARDSGGRILLEPADSAARLPSGFLASVIVPLVNELTVLLDSLNEMYHLTDLPKFKERISEDKFAQATKDYQALVEQVQALLRDSNDLDSRGQIILRERKNLLELIQDFSRRLLQEEAQRQAVEREAAIARALAEEAQRQAAAIAKARAEEAQRQAAAIAKARAEAVQSQAAAIARARAEGAAAAVRDGTGAVDPIKVELLQLWKSKRYEEAINKCRTKEEARELLSQLGHTPQTVTLARLIAKRFS